MADTELDLLIDELGGPNAKRPREGSTAPRGAAKRSKRGSITCAIPDTRAHACLNGPARGSERAERGIPKVDVVEECRRHRAVRALSVAFSKLIAPHLGGRWHKHFEAWLFARRRACSSPQEPVLPLLHAGELTDADVELIRKLVAAGMKRVEAEALCLGLTELPAQLKRQKLTAVAAPHSNIKIKFKNVPEASDKVSLQCHGVKLEVNRAHLDKLRTLFTGNLPAGATFEEPKFRAAALAVLARYSALQGTHHRAGGFQAALHREVFDVLKARFGTTMECFASPLNCRWPQFCSLFLDTDAPFGSLGSFFRFRPSDGSFIANPPFDQELVLRMADHMLNLLEASKGALMFVVTVPSWPGADCSKRLEESQWTVRVEHLAALEHGYCEGAQHNRASQHRPAYTASSIYILQTRSAVERWPADDGAVAALRDAFAPKSVRGDAELACLDMAGVCKAAAPGADSDGAAVWKGCWRRLEPGGGEVKQAPEQKSRQAKRSEAVEVGTTKRRRVASRTGKAGTGASAQAVMQSILCRKQPGKQA